MSKKMARISPSGEPVRLEGDEGIVCVEDKPDLTIWTCRDDTKPVASSSPLSTEQQCSMQDDAVCIRIPLQREDTQFYFVDFRFFQETDPISFLRLPRQGLILIAGANPASLVENSFLCDEKQQ